MRRKRGQRRWRDRGWLGRWALYRRWGPKATWNGNNAHDITITDRGEDGYGGARTRFLGEAWTTCRCGKVYQISVTGETEKLVRQMLVLKGSFCEPCAAWTAKRANFCPDGNCTLGYEHKGRCQPLVITDEMRQEMLAKAGRSNAQEG